MKKNEPVIGETKCIDCHKEFRSDDKFYYTVTKRKTRVFIHKECWDNVPKLKVVMPDASI